MIAHHSINFSFINLQILQNCRLIKDSAWKAFQGHSISDLSIRHAVTCSIFFLAKDHSQLLFMPTRLTTDVMCGILMDIITIVM